MKILKITGYSIAFLLMIFNVYRSCNDDGCANEAFIYKNDKFYLKMENIYIAPLNRGITIEGHDNEGKFFKYEENSIWLRDSHLVLGDSIKKDSGIACFYLKKRNNNYLSWDTICHRCADKVK